MRMQGLWNEVEGRSGLGVRRKTTWIMLLANKKSQRRMRWPFWCITTIDVARITPGLVALNPQCNAQKVRGSKEKWL